MNVMDLTCWWLSTTVPTQGFVFVHGQVGTTGVHRGEVGQEQHGQTGTVGIKTGQVS